MSDHFVQGLKLAAALLAPVVTTLFFRARALATARALVARSLDRNA